MSLSPALLFAAATAVLLLAHAARAVRHSFFFSRSELPRRFDLLLALSFSYALNAILPLRIGELVRVLFVAVRVRLRIPYVAATVIAERLSDLVVVAGIAAVLAARSGSSAAGIPATGLALLAATLVAGAVLVRRSLAVRRTVWHVAALFNDRIKVGIVELVWSTSQLLLDGPFLTLRYLAATAGMWTLYFTAYALFASAVGLSTAQVSLALLGAPLQPLLLELLRGAVSHSSLMLLLFTAIPIVAVMAYGLIRNRREILRSVEIARRFGFTRPEQELPSVSRRFRNASDYSVFLLAHFGASNDLVSTFAAEGMDDVVVHRFLPGGSDAVTAVVEVGGVIGIRKLAAGDAGARLAEQAVWLREHAGALPLPSVVAERRHADRFHYDMPFTTTASDFYDVIHTTPVERSQAVLRSVVDGMMAFHEANRMGKADDAAVDAYLERKVRANAAEILSYARLAVGEAFTINGTPHRLSDWDCLGDMDWLRAQVGTRDVARIHGDLTIENIIVCPERPNGWYLIDPNPHNLFDTPLIDWAKLTQSLNLGYEGLNRGATATVSGDAIQLVLTRSSAYAQLDSFFSTLLWERIGEEGMREVAFHELVHYLRLTPYKIRRSPQKGLAFFACSAMLLQRYREQAYA